MDPQRTVSPGPMAPTSVKNCRKSFAALKTLIRENEDQKEITPKISTGHVDRRQRPDKVQIFDGKVNIFSCVDTVTDMLCCKYTEDGSDVAAGFSDGVIRLFNVSTGDCSHTLTDAECRTSPSPVTTIKHRPVSKAHPTTNELFATYANGWVKCWKYRYDQCLYTVRENRQTLGLTYHPIYPKFVTLGDDARINMYDEETRTHERSFYASEGKRVIDGHASQILACAFNPRGKHELISGGWDSTVICWDDRQPYATRHFVGPYMNGEGLDFDKHGKQILTCSWQEEDSIQIWDYGSCQLIETITPDIYPCKLYCGKLVPKTKFMVCGGSDSNMLRVVDMDLKSTVCCIRNNNNPIYAFDFGMIRRKKPSKVEDKDNKEDPNKEDPIKEDPNKEDPNKEDPNKETEPPAERPPLYDVPRIVFVSGKRMQSVDFG